MTQAPEPHPFRKHLWIAVTLTILVTLLLAWLPSWPSRWMAWLLLWLVAINLITFLYFAYDKRQAARQGRRVPEAVLHVLALLGGTPGAWLGMRFFHHKTMKRRFQIVNWGIVVVQGVLFVVWLRWMWAS